MNKHLGDVVIRLVDDKVEEVAVSSLEGEGKVVAVLFSAHWCPPCRAFNPQLAKWYRRLKAGPNGDKFEIVFVSSDRDEKTFMDFFKGMPWLALPYAERTRKHDLSRKFMVAGLPSLTLVNAANGVVITGDGRSVMVEDSSGKRFPWIPGPIMEVLRGKFLKGHKGREVESSYLRGKTLGIYFGAYWCGQARLFNSQLASIYKKMKSRGIKFEVVYISSDKDERQWKASYSVMPWLALPYGDHRKRALLRMFNVQGIPTLVMIDINGKVINLMARSAVGMDLKGEMYPWYPEPVRQLTGLTGVEMNDVVSLVWFKYDQKCIELKLIMRPVALRWIDEWKDMGEEQLMMFYVTGSDIDDEDEVAIALTKFAALKKDTQMAIVDINNSMVYESDATDVNTDVIGAFVEDFFNQSLEGKSLRK